LPILIVALSLALIGLLFRNWRLKRDIRQLHRTLALLRKEPTNARLVSLTFDADIRALATAINQLLDDQGKLAHEVEKERRAFSQGITNISHDLRTPLTSALGFVQLVKTRQETDYLDIVEERLKMLTGLLNNLLEYSRLVEKTGEPTLEKGNVCHLLQDALANYYEDFVQAGFEVKLSIPDQPLLATFDRKLLGRVFQNLVENVLAHGTDYFELEVLPYERAIIFKNRIVDSDTVEIDHLFNRFYTSDNSRSSKRTGLGLAITQEIMSQINGEASAYWDGELFCIRLEFK